MTMFAAALRRSALRAAPRSVRFQSSKASLLPPAVVSRWYNIFGKSNAAYGAWIVIGVLVCEGLTGSINNMVWNSVNHGKTFDTVDWTKFKTDDDEDDEEEDDDDDDEEEGDDDDDDDDDE